MPLESSIGWLVGLSENISGRRFALDREEILIGRGSDCHIQLKDPRVSRKHAQITIKAGQLTIEDLDSTQGVLINGERVDDCQLKDGDRVQLGDTQLQVEYLTFEGGSGVRFVSQYGQAAWPINNSDLFYAYQGLTDDGMYLISAILPVSHPSLPADGDTFIGDEYDAFINAYEAYLLNVESQLAIESPLSFSPQLTDLDAMMESMQIESP